MLGTVAFPGTHSQVIIFQLGVLYLLLWQGIQKDRGHLGCDWVSQSCVETANVSSRPVVYVCTEGRDEGKDGVRAGLWLSSFHGVLAMSVSAAALLGKVIFWAQGFPLHSDVSVGPWFLGVQRKNTCKL